jgi:AraC-like DNA-binding protein/mannose-6-phosphate isomerase-like protein (cupin superfamily)
MAPNTRELLKFLGAQPKEQFLWQGRIDGRRHLAREFPGDLPLRLQLQEYPDHDRLVGDNWMHWHEYYEFFVALSGPGQVRVGGATFAFDTGDMVIVDPLKVHGVTRMAPTHTALVVHFPGAAVAASGLAADRLFLDAWERRSERLLPRLGAAHPAAGAVHGALLRLCRAWFAMPASAARLGALKVHLLELLLGLRGALATADAASVEAPATRSLRESRLQRALEHISVHSHRALAQPEVARAAGMSTGRFRAFFKETTGWGFGDYLRDLRLERAARLLRETDESIANIAHATGFADQSHLQRLFKLKHKLSPRRYRQQHPARTVAGELFKK